MKTVLRKRLPALITAPCFAGALLAITALDAKADTNVLVGEVGQFTSPDDLQLDPALAIIAVAVYGDISRDVNGVTFLPDGRNAGSGTATNGTVSVTTRAANQIDNWTGPPAFTGGTPGSAANLAEIMRDIRWNGAPNPITVDIEGLTPGAPYRIQLLTNEGADRNRRWDIAVEDELVVDDYTSEGLHTQFWTGNNSAYYKGTFNAPPDGILNIRMQQNIGGAPNPGGDNNPILQAVIVHLDFISVDGDLLNDPIEQRIIDANPNDAITTLEEVLEGDDFDEDGLTNLQEQGTTDPTDADSDDDGLIDGAEVSDYLTDPKKPDTDGDGLSDGDEVNTHGTDPTKADTDGDIVNDALEIAKGTDPLDGADTPEGIRELHTASALATGTYLFIGEGVAFDFYVQQADGKSWVLVGRGREGWQFDADGQGSVAEVGDSSIIGTPDAFAPAMYSDALINALLDASTTDKDGVDIDLTGVELRIRRAANPEGTAYSEARWRPTTQTTWRGNFDAQFAVEHEIVSTGGVAGADIAVRAGGNTRDTEIGGNDGDRIFTWAWDGHGNKKGFSYGSIVTNGANNATSFLWENGNENHAMPYAELYIRLENPDPAKIELDDVDSDGMPDIWETSWPGITTLAQLTAAGDFDNDGVDDPDEFDNSTDPTKKDTDGDGLEDGAELAGGTSPTNPDSDGDGLSDGVETDTGVFVSASNTGTDPNNSDTDGDGESDFNEILLASDPNDPADVPPQGTVVIVGEVGQFTSPDDLHLDPATALIAVDVYGDLDRDVNGVTFQTDGRVAGRGTVTRDGVTVTTRAANQIDNWTGPPAFTGGTPDSAANLAEIMRDIRWEGAPNPVLVDIEGLIPGLLYEIQLLTNEGANRNRRWDIAVEEVLVVDDFTSEGLTSQTWAPDNSAYYRGEFEAPGDGILNIRMQQNIGGRPNPGGDNNPILQAVIVHLVSAPGLFLDVESSGDNLILTWESKGGELYNVRSETDLSVGGEEGPVTWPIFDGHADIEATPPLNTLTIPRPADRSRFFVVEGFPAPPESIFFDDFESGQGAWTLGSDGAVGTAWELGTPSSGPPSAKSPVNCFATNLAGDYGFNANVWLRSPAIDLTTAGSATLSYFEFKDIEATFDSGAVRVLDAADNSLLAVLDAAVDGSSLEWKLIKKPLPGAALGKVIKIEFRFTSDDVETFAGWYLDDVQVTVP